MDTRTVISGIPYGTYSDLQIDLFSFLNKHQLSDSVESRMLKSMLSSESAVNSFDNIIKFVTRHKSFFELNIEKIPLNKINNWNINDYGNKPAQKHQSGVAMVSGFSPSLLKSLLSGEDLSPISMMMKVIGDSRYDAVVA
jgi:hypothetical protein